jgi:hypothetical protein
MPVALLAAVLALLAGQGRPARAAEEDFAGTWKVSVFTQSQEEGPLELGWWLVKIEGKSDKAKGALVSAEKRFKGSTVEKVKVSADSVRFTLKTKGGDFTFVAYAPKAKGKDRPKELLGALLINEQRLPARLGRSDLKEIDEKKASVPLEGVEDLEKALDLKSDKERDKALLALLDKVASKPLGYFLAQGLLQNKAGKGAPPAELRAQAERYARIAAAYGRELELHACYTAAQMASQAGKAPALADELAGKAAGLLRADDSPVYTANVLRLQFRALWNVGKAEQAKALVARLGKLSGPYHEVMVARAQELAQQVEKRKGAPRERIEVLKNLASTYHLAGKEAEAKKVEAELAKVERQAQAARLKVLRGNYQKVKESKDATPQERLVRGRVLARALAKAGKADEAKKLTAEVAPLEKEQAKRELDAARKGVEELEKEPPARDRESALKALSRALKRNGKLDEARKVDAELAKVTEEVNKEFAKKAVPFKVEAFAGRKGKGDRVALVEMFTGAQCPPCVAADIAFDAALKRYKPSEVVFLQYHLHIPGPDPLTNPDTVARMEHYGDEVQGCPTAFVNGERTAGLGGTKAEGQDSYGRLRDQIERQLDVPAQVAVKVSAARKGSKIDLEARVTDLVGASDTLRLRFALVEDVVGYYGRNRQRLHHHVVRALPGGAAGQAVRGKAATLKASVDVDEVRKNLAEYLAEFGDESGRLDEDRPLALKKLKVVAFVQDEVTREVLQAAQVDVPAAKE